MKKYALLFVAAGVIGLTSSCGDNENNTTQAQIDSTAAARSAIMEADLKAKNDSLINEMAKMRADSAMNMSAPTATTTTTTTTTAPAASSAPMHTTKVKTHTSSSTTKTNEPKTDAPKPTITKEQVQEQNNKFNER